MRVDLLGKFCLKEKTQTRQNKVVSDMIALCGLGTREERRRCRRRLRLRRIPFNTSTERLESVPFFFGEEHGKRPVFRRSLPFHSPPPYTHKGTESGIRKVYGLDDNGSRTTRANPQCWAWQALRLEEGVLEKDHFGGLQLVETDQDCVRLRSPGPLRRIN